METDFITFVSQVAFPIVMCTWFMFRMEKVIKANTDATNELRKEIKNSRNSQI